MTQQLSQLACAVEARGLSKTYGSSDSTVVALRGVDLAIRSGRFTAIMGHSGSGKSTLMHCLAGLDAPSSGSVRIGGVEITTLNDDALTIFRREHLGFVFQAFNLLPMLTAEQNIVLPFELAGHKLKSADRERFEQVVDVLGIENRLRHHPSELSGGQQQRVAIARALITAPDVIFADEPTGNLDSETTTEVLSYLRRSVHELNQTVVIVTHELDAAAYADEVVVLEDGEVRNHLMDPTPDELLDALQVGVR